MLYYIVIVRWSQTDNDTVIVKSSSHEEARLRMQYKYPTARYIEYQGVSRTLIE